MKQKMATAMKWIGICLIGLGVIYAILILAANISLRHEYESLRADGRPMTVESIIPKSVPDSENAASLYDVAIKMLLAEPPMVFTGYVGKDTCCKTLLSQADKIAADAIDNPTNVPMHETRTSHGRQMTPNLTTSSLMMCHATAFLPVRWFRFWAQSRQSG
jgi:hypothetical protein